MKKITSMLLSELLKNSKRSDRELAKVLGVSQPTVTRRRSKLVKDGVIREFTIIPDFVKMGYEIMAISCIKTKQPISDKLTEKTKEWMMRFTNVIFVANAEGMGKNGIMISLHKNYTEYAQFVREQLTHWEADMQDYDSMLISLKGIIAKPLSLTYLAEEKPSEE